MSEIIHRLYGVAHLLAKKAAGRKLLEVTPGLHPFVSLTRRPDKDCESLWRLFIQDSKIPDSQLHYAGYNEDLNQWCLPSWIWTNAAIVRALVSYDLESALLIGEKLLSCQEKVGGWIVRNDYDKKGPYPVLAPNDSAYIANNCMLEIFLKTRDNRFLESAKRCAQWIIETSRPDGIVYTGLNLRDKIWNKNGVIVDVGFTAALFARLYEITKIKSYYEYLQTFVYRYIDLFYVHSEKAFCTSIKSDDSQIYGLFGRGQGWALEGLIPAYKTLGDERIKQLIDNCVDTILKFQTSEGAWPYNFKRPLMGNDCKGVAVIARSLLDWYRITGHVNCKEAAQKAITWCKNHTRSNGAGKGGIFCYSVEGEVVKNLYSSCAFVYACAYALETSSQLNILP